MARLLAQAHPEYSITVLDKMDYCASEANLVELQGRQGFRWAASQGGGSIDDDLPVAWRHHGCSRGTASPPHCAGMAV